MIASVVGGPEMPVAVNVTTVSPVTVAVRLFVPDAVPSVQLPNRAMPAVSVSALAPVMLPPPPVTANTTGTAASDEPPAFVTRTAGAVGTVAPTGPLCPLPATATTLAGPLDVAIVNANVAGVSVPDDATTVTVPALCGVTSTHATPCRSEIVDV